jgi:ubiquinone/menaquinone biosynthesis C-methylase UbiE
MGFYARVIFPRLCDWMMNDPRMAALRGEALSHVKGNVLEIGFGTGLNLAHYRQAVFSVTTVDPNSGMGRLAQKRIAASAIPVDRRVASGEELPLANESFDCVVSTWTLCSIPEVNRALREIHRVLKPGGSFVFLEHGLSDDPRIQRWQRRLNPIQRRIGDGCRLDLDVEAAVRGQPFAEVHIERFLMERTPRTHGTMYRGTALK